MDKNCLACGNTGRQKIDKRRPHAGSMSPANQTASGNSVVESTLRSTMNERTCRTPGR